MYWGVMQVWVCKEMWVLLWFPYFVCLHYMVCSIIVFIMLIYGNFIKNKRVCNIIIYIYVKINNKCKINVKNLEFNVYFYLCKNII